MIGAALTAECIRHNVEVLAIVRPGSVHRSRIPCSDRVKVYECYLDSLHSVCPDSTDYDVFYHLAWDYTAREMRDNPVLQEQNIKYSLDAVFLAHKLGCKKFIGAGSQAEYGPVDSIISEATPVNPQTAYGSAKLAAAGLTGKLCEQYNMIHIWTRIFSVYGRYDHAGTMLVYAIERFQRNEKACFSSADQPWDYLHEKDAGVFFFLLGELVNESKLYCVANGRSYPLRRYIEVLCEQFDGVQCEFSEDRGGTFGLQADISRLIQDTGYVPKVSFEEGIKDMVDYLIN